MLSCLERNLVPTTTLHPGYSEQRGPGTRDWGGATLTTPPAVAFWRRLPGPRAATMGLEVSLGGQWAVGKGGGRRGH